MADNFFTDNLDLQFRLERLALGEVVDILEDGYRYHDEYDAAPRHYADAVDSYRLLLTILGDICANHVAPRAAETDEISAQCQQGCVTYAPATQEAMALLRQTGLVGAMLPWEHGGLNLPETILEMVIEVISRADASLMTVYGLQEIAIIMIAEYGDDDMKARILPRVIEGNLQGGAMVLTEPDAGSDLGSVQTRATFDESAGAWRISGVKRFITTGCGDVLLVLARSEDGTRDARGLSLFEVTADATVRVRRIENKLGLHGSPTCELQFTDTPARLIGDRRFGLIRYAMAMMNGARLAVSAQALGIAEAAYREAHRYACQRVQFGQPICEIPAVYRMLLNMRADIEAARALLYETARWVDLSKAIGRLKDRGGLTPDGRRRQKQASRLADVLTPLLKYSASEMANRVAYQAMQVHGGVGYMREFAVERHYRDARITNIYEGTSQLQVVAATSGLLGHALDGLLDEWAAEGYGDQLTDLKTQLQEATGLLNACIDGLKEEDDRAVIDYYAPDLADMAVYVISSWLTLRDARETERKRDVARFYITDAVPRIHASAEILMNRSRAPVQLRHRLLNDSA